MPTQWERMGEHHEESEVRKIGWFWIISLCLCIGVTLLPQYKIPFSCVWNDPRDFAKPVKAISFPQDVLSTSDRRLIELKNQVQRLMEAHIAPMQPIQVNKITSLCEIYSAPHDTQYYMEDPEQAFVKYASSRTDKAEDNKLEGEVREEEDNPKNIKPNPSLPPDPSVSLVTKKFHQLNSLLESLGLVPQSSDTEFVFTKGDDNDVMFIEIIKKNDDSYEEEPNTDESARTEELRVEYFNIFLTRSELAYRKHLISGPIPSIFMRNPIITEGCQSNLKIQCNIGHVLVEKSYINLNSPLNIMTQTLYNWIIRRKLDPKSDPNRRISNFTRRIKGMHVFVGNFTYVIDFMIVKDISSIIDPRLSQVLLGKPFAKISNMTHDPPEGVVGFTNMADEVAYKMPHKIEQYNSLSELEKEHTKSVYLRNEEDKRRGVEYVMNKILGFYKECLELGPKYVNGIANEGEVT
ncbi:hypothetical protein Tco_0573637 [Tanacetum coccineum]